MKRTKFKTVNALVCATTSKTFQAYWKEMRRHEKALTGIYAHDKRHKHVPELIGSVSNVWPKQKHLVSFYRCAICMKEL